MHVHVQLLVLCRVHGKKGQPLRLQMNLTMCHWKSTPTAGGLYCIEKVKVVLKKTPINNCAINSEPLKGF